MKITCNVIKDLLPLYYDRICSEDTRKIVDEHLEHCEECRRELAYMSGDFLQDINLKEEQIRKNAIKSAKKFKSNNILLGFLAAICSIGIIAIVLTLIFSFSRPSLDKCEYQYHLKPGIYEVGTHIPVGTYFVEANTEETCAFEVGEITEGFLFVKSYNEVRNKTDLMRPYRGKWRVEIKNRMRNISLKEGQLLIIRPNQELLFYSKKVDLDTLAPIQNTADTGYMASEYEYYGAKTSVSGTDFEPGVYDIVYSPTDVNKSGKIGCVLRFKGAYESEYTMTFECKGEDGAQIIYKNIPFTEESTIAVSGIEDVELVPSKYTSETFNEITSN